MSILALGAMLKQKQQLMCCLRLLILQKTSIRSIVLFIAISLRPRLHRCINLKKVIQIIKLHRFMLCFSYVAVLGTDVEIPYRSLTQMSLSLYLTFRKPYNTPKSSARFTQNGFNTVAVKCSTFCQRDLLLQGGVSLLFWCLYVHKRFSFRHK